MRGGLGEGAEQEFADFVAASAPSLIALAYAICGDVGRAQDAAQTAFERVYLRWSRIDDPRAYARRVAVNATRDGWRRVGRFVQVGLPTDPGGGHEPFGAVDDRDEVLRALRTLPHGQRAVLVLRYWQDLSEAETAAALGISTGTVKSQTSRALKKLRALLGATPDVATTRGART